MDHADDDSECAGRLRGPLMGGRSARRRARSNNGKAFMDASWSLTTTRNIEGTKGTKNNTKKKTFWFSSCVFVCFVFSWLSYGCRLKEFAPGWVPEMNASR